MVLMVCVALAALASPMGLRPAFATEHDFDEGKLTCLVSFRIEDGTGGAFPDDVEVRLTDAMTARTFEFTLERGAGYEARMRVYPNTTYLVDVSYPNSGLFTLENADGSGMDAFVVEDGPVDIVWEAFGVGDARVARTGTVEAGSAEAETKAQPKGAAATLFKEFYDAVKHMDGDDEWNDFFRSYDMWSAVRSKRYVEVCGGTTDEWEAMSDFEKLVWDETYVRIVDRLNASNYDYYFGTEKNFEDNTIFPGYHALTTYGDGTEAAAYKKLMLWQYEYIKEHGSPYNFMTGLDYVQSKPGAKPVDPEREKKEAAERERRELESVRREFERELALDLDQDEPAGLGVWGKTAKAVAANVVSILILLVLSGALTVVVLRRRRGWGKKG
jgi:hypothetical protein